MKKKQFHRFYVFLKESFFEGFRKISPFIFFAIILYSIFGLLLRGIGIIEKLFPRSVVAALNLPEPIAKVFEVVIVCILILAIGMISKQESVSRRFEKWLIPVIYRVPLLGFLYKITNQVSFNLKDTSIFKEAVYVEVFFGIYKMGFVTGDSPKSCCKAIKIKGMKSVVIPYYPFTSAELWDVDPKRIKPTGMTVAEATAYLISLKTAMSKNKQEKVSKKNRGKRRRNRRKREKNEEEHRNQESPTLKQSETFFIVFLNYNIIMKFMYFYKNELNLMGEKDKKRNHFLTGLVMILPTVLFFVILGRIISLILRRIGKIVELFPDAMVDKLGLPDLLIHFLGFLVLCGLIRLLGFILNQGHVGERVKACLDPLIEKIPLLNSLTKITNQAANTLQNTNSFKKVVLVKFPTEKTWSVGFLTGEDLDVFENAIGETNLVSVFIPTTPNPANGYLVMLNPRDFVETEVPVSDAISFVISMGTVGATNKILKKSHSTSE